MYVPTFSFKLPFNNLPDYAQKLMRSVGARKGVTVDVYVTSGDLGSSWRVRKSAQPSGQPLVAVSDPGMDDAGESRLTSTYQGATCVAQYMPGCGRTHKAIYMLSLKVPTTLCTTVGARVDAAMDAIYGDPKRPANGYTNSQRSITAEICTEVFAAFWDAANGSTPAPVATTEQNNFMAWAGVE